MLRNSKPTRRQVENGRTAVQHLQRGWIRAAAEQDQATRATGLLIVSQVGASGGVHSKLLGKLLPGKLLPESLMAFEPKGSGSPGKEHEPSRSRRRAVLSPVGTLAACLLLRVAVALLATAEILLHRLQERAR